MTTKEIGAQLWLFNQIHAEAAMHDILAALADAGYAFVETMHGRPPFSRTPLNALHLRDFRSKTSVHLGAGDLDLRAVLSIGGCIAQSAHRLGRARPRHRHTAGGHAHKPSLAGVTWRVKHPSASHTL